MNEYKTYLFEISLRYQTPNIGFSRVVTEECHVSSTDPVKAHSKLLRCMSKYDILDFSYKGEINSEEL